MGFLEESIFCRIKMSYFYKNDNTQYECGSHPSVMS